MVVENDGRPKKVSPKGARGLMQVMPNTVKELAAFDKDAFGYLLDAKGNARMNLLDDPKTGIEAGMAALKMYMDRYDGDAEKALAAYNGGPARVKFNKPLILAAMPPETQQYVADIREILKKTQKLELPRASLLHFLPPADARKYRRGKGGS